MKPFTFPPCGTCELKVPDDKVKETGTYWCHGAPPTGFPETVVIVGPDNQPSQQKRVSGYYAPVMKDTPGCAMHPVMRKKLRN